MFKKRSEKCITRCINNTSFEFVPFKYRRIAE